MESSKEIRFYLANKQTWNDVTAQVTTRGIDNIIPKEGNIVNVGKIKFRVAKVTDDRKYYKVWLENKEATLTPMEEALENLENIEVISIDTPVDEALKTGALGKGPKNLLFGLGERPDPTALNNWVTATGPGTKMSMGGFIRSSLGSMGAGYGVQVSDFGEICVVTINYSNSQTSRTGSATFAVISRGKGSPYAYTVYANSARWRNCNGIDQAINFIRSKSNALAGSVNSVL